MKHLFTVLIILPLSILLTGCPGCGVPESIGACGVSNPAESLPWLKSELDATKTAGAPIADYTVYQATYKGATVFWIDTCCPLCILAPPQVRKCDGTVAGQFTVDINDSDLSNTKAIWKTNNGVCH